MKEKRKKILRWGLIFLVFIFLFGNRGFRTLVVKYFQLRRLEEELSKIKKENEALRKELYTLETDPSAIERIARVKLSFVKPGEIIYRFAPPDSEQERKDKSLK